MKFMPRLGVSLRVNRDELSITRGGLMKFMPRLGVSFRVNRDEFVHYQRRANEVYAEAGRQFSARN